MGQNRSKSTRESNYAEVKERREIERWDGTEGMRKHSLFYFSIGIRLLVTGWSEKCGSCRLIGRLLQPGPGGIVASPSPNAAAKVLSINAYRLRLRDHIIVHISLHQHF